MPVGAIKGSQDQQPAPSAFSAALASCPLRNPREIVGGDQLGVGPFRQLFGHFPGRLAVARPQIRDRLLQVLRCWPPRMLASSSGYGPRWHDIWRNRARAVPCPWPPSRHQRIVRSHEGLLRKWSPEPRHPPHLTSRTAHISVSDGKYRPAVLGRTHGRDFLIGEQEITCIGAEIPAMVGLCPIG